MWLIDTNSLKLQNFQVSPPAYAILSHRWGSNNDEVSFQEWHDDHGHIAARPGYSKILKACEQARRDNLEYLWVDTNCIDKKSSSELSEAINSMYHFYERASVCYAYLSDVHDPRPPQPPGSNLPGNAEFRKSAWFTRGWTLQELLAPQNLIFFNSQWISIGTKAELRGIISNITGISGTYLVRGRLSTAHISTRMSWASNRITTRLEDIAYCLLGIFGVNMPLLYGEGHRAFQRLQEELIKTSDDQTVFAWDWLPRFPHTGRRSPNFPTLRSTHLVNSGWDVRPIGNSAQTLDRTPYQSAQVITSGATSMFAPDPVFFYASSYIGPYNQGSYVPSVPYIITNKGLSITLNIYDPRPSQRTKKTYFGDHQPLGMLTMFYSGSSCSGVAVFLGGDRITEKTYARAFYTDYELDRSQMFRGHLMAVTLPKKLFEKFFRPTAIFVRQSDTMHSIFQWDQAPGVAVWPLNDPKNDNVPRIKMRWGKRRYLLGNLLGNYISLQQ
ncbi:hypothetical protein OQA88_7737 [Cercophora sp. LCS_1]